MNRRDFLLFRKKGEKQIAQLSCEKLYMYFSDSLTAETLRKAESGITHDEQWWSAEPAGIISNLDANSLFASVSEEIIKADVLVVKDKEWIIEGEFASYMNSLFTQFIENGGNIEFQKDAA